jgi:hypothetical protein
VCPMSRATMCGVEAEGSDPAENSNVIEDPKIPTQSETVESRRFTAPAWVLVIVLTFKRDAALSSSTDIQNEE